MPAEGGGVSPLAAVASPSGAAPAVEAGSRAGRRGRSGARSKEKRRLVLLRHAKSSFADLSLRGRGCSNAEGARLGRHAMRALGTVCLTMPCIWEALVLWCMLAAISVC